jgi:hypothetical protein
VTRVVTVLDTEGGRKALKFVVLIVLAALWAVVLVPPLLRARTSRSNDSIGDFNYRLGVLSRTNGNGRRRGPRHRPARPVLSPPVSSVVGPAASPLGAYAGPRMSASQRTAKRRRDITLGLAVAAALTLAFAVLANSTSVWALHGLVDVMFVGYLGLLAWARSLSMQPRGSSIVRPAGNVRYLHERPAPELALRPAPELALRRTASS